MTEGMGAVLPIGALARIKLDGEKFQLPILSISPEDGDNVIVQYPDGHRHHHQATDIVSLLEKVANVLKYRYNLNKFDFDGVPAFEVGAVITVKGIEYDS